PAPVELEPAPRLVLTAQEHMLSEYLVWAELVHGWECAQEILRRGLRQAHDLPEKPHLGLIDLVGDSPLHSRVDLGRTEARAADQKERPDGLLPAHRATKVAADEAALAVRDENDLLAVAILARIRDHTLKASRRNFVTEAPIVTAGINAGLAAHRGEELPEVVA